MNFCMEFDRIHSLRNSHVASYIGAKRAKDFARYGISNGLNTEARDGTKVTVDVAIKRISWNRRGALIKRAVCLSACQEIGIRLCFGLLSQMQNALKRGVNYGILKKTDGQYSLPTDNEITRQEVAAQEIGLLDLYCQRKIHRSKGGRTRRNRRTGRSQRVVCRCNKKGMRRRSRGCRSRSCRRRRGGSSGFDRRVHDGTMKSKIEPILDVDKLTDKSTKSNRTMTRANMIDDIERSNSSNMSPEQWDHSISLSC
ncbi:hypothetical protein ALC56_10265 [Trachymyrmex septentrionalis]|uniref:Uncharacterized protein n=1 Tax=Trachymyrmex septentrionalis TaxID=34720 RepID=A0A195F4C4_9HYME|nr:hypothetical protein ALC56_10265 [Trachymyrmex septentrionalis]